MLQNVAEQITEGTDYIVIAHKDGKYGGISKGNTDAIAQAFFTLMHDPKSKAGAALFRIMKLNVLNTLNNPTPFAANLAESIHNVLDKENE